MAAREKIKGTSYDNTEEGVAALLNGHRTDVLLRERMRVAANERRARGEFDEELASADEALRLILSINRLRDWTDLLEEARDTIDRAIRSGFEGSDVPDVLDALVESASAHTEQLAIQLQNLAWTSATIRNGVTPDDNDT